jgi:acyl-coenzyme A thioesterase PaaI-like protein
VSVEVLSPGFVRLRMPIDGNANHMGTMYAGALFAVAELPGGLLPWTVLRAGAVVPIAKAVTVEYRRAALTDVTVEASMDPVAIQELARQAAETGKADFTLELSVRDVACIEVMTAVTTTQLRCIGGPSAQTTP